MHVATETSANYLASKIQCGIPGCIYSKVSLINIILLTYHEYIVANPCSKFEVEYLHQVELIVKTKACHVC